MYKFLPILLCLVLFQCSDSVSQKELSRTKIALQEAEKELELVQRKLAEVEKENLNRLVHLVFFKVNPTADQKALITKIKTLDNIAVVKELEVGPFEALGDPRALSEYQLMMQLVFENTADYKTYQEHPIHKDLQEYAKPFLAGPPASYDFVSK